MAGHLGQGLGAEGALLRLCLRAEEGHPLHFSHIELNKKNMGTACRTNNLCSGSGSFHHQAKIEKQNHDFMFEDDVNVTTKSNKQKNLEKGPVQCTSVSFISQE
jgi:hypothetical protein